MCNMFAGFTPLCNGCICAVNNMYAALCFGSFFFTDVNDVLLTQIHRSDQSAHQTKVDIIGTLEAQLSAKLLIEGATSQQMMPAPKGIHVHTYMSTTL